MSTFRFKQFEIQQKLSAAKVGTDGVLLGAWVTVNNPPKNILDIGTGTGLIALMMAQKFSQSKITAIEIEENAYIEAQFNFNQSRWRDRLKIEHTDLLSYKTSVKYDLIVSNPPFYKEDTLSTNHQRSMARSVKHLPFDVLIQKSASLLTDAGVLQVVIPYANEPEFLDLSRHIGLYPLAVCHVKGHAQSPVKRSLLALSKSPTNYTPQNLVIEEERHQYTPDYIALTQDFYLHM